MQLLSINPITSLAFYLRHFPPPHAQPSPYSSTSCLFRAPSSIFHSVVQSVWIRNTRPLPFPVKGREARNDRARPYLHHISHTNTTTTAARQRPRSLLIKDIRTHTHATMVVFFLPSTTHQALAVFPWRYVKGLVRGAGVLLLGQRVDQGACYGGDVVVSLVVRSGLRIAHSHPFVVGRQTQVGLDASAW